MFLGQDCLDTKKSTHLDDQAEVGPPQRASRAMTHRMALFLPLDIFLDFVFRRYSSYWKNMEAKKFLELIVLLKVTQTRKYKKYCFCFPSLYKTIMGF